MNQLNTVSTQTIIQTKYTWDISQSFPFESTWSFLQKFTILNACGARDIQREFGIASKRQHPQNWSCRDRDLHGWGALNPVIIQQSLNLTNLQVKTACTLDYIRRDEAKVLASRSLRICPKCVREGFHTPFHQLLFISNCPLHNELLLNVCVDCGKPTPLYSLSRQSFCNPYGCAECGTVWWQRGSVGQHPAWDQEERFRIMSEIGEWLAQRRDDRTIEANMSRLSRFIPDGHEFQVCVRRLPERWADVLGVKVPQLMGGPRDTDLHITMEYTTPRVENPSSTVPFSNKPFFDVYRAIRRSLARQLRKNHRDCFEKMGRGIWFPVSGRELPLRQFCQEAYAFLLWRMFWENIDIPQKFFSRQLLLIRSEIDLVSDRIPLGIPEEAAIRIFGLECLRTFRRCQELGASMQEKDHITFPLYRLNNDRGSEWILKIAKSGSTQRLHWWWPKRWEAAHSFQNHQSKRPHESVLRIAC